MTENPGFWCPDQRPVDLLALAGNTVMCHLFAGLSPESIGAAPFTPLSRFGTTMDAGQAGIAYCKNIYIAPAAAGYVGGDITADLLAVRISAEEETLLLDIGTNGEMVLGKAGDFVCCATAAGPAFEGAEISMGMPAAEGAVSAAVSEEAREELTRLRESMRYIELSAHQAFSEEYMAQMVF